jgi:Domain of unknown function DUF29
MQTQTLYELDFYAWTIQQAELICSGRLELLDVNNLVEEIESFAHDWVGQSDDLLAATLCLESGVRLQQMNGCSGGACTVCGYSSIFAS